MMKTMMPSVYYTQKTSSSKTCANDLQNASECLHLFAFKMRCLAIFAKSLGPTCEKVWDEVQPQIADNIVDGRNPAKPVDMENLALFTGFYLRW